MGSKNCKVTVRLTAYQEQVLKELSLAFDASFSMLIRTIVGDWLTNHEEYIERIIEKRLLNANNTENREEKDIFGEEGD